MMNSVEQLNNVLDEVIELIEDSQRVAESCYDRYGNGTTQEKILNLYTGVGSALCKLEVFQIRKLIDETWSLEDCYGIEDKAKLLFSKCENLEVEVHKIKAVKELAKNLTELAAKFVNESTYVIDELESAIFRLNYDFGIDRRCANE